MDRRRLRPRARRSGPTAPAAATSSRRPGHYIEPSFSPDGKSIVYPQRRRRRHSRAALRRRRRASTSCRPTARRRRGSCAKAARIRSSITPARASTSATSATSKYTLAERRRGDRGVAAAGRRRDRARSQSDNATQIVPSPDGKWVAFEERWHTYVAAFPRTGRPIDIGPTTQAYPVAARLARRGLLPPLVGRQPPAALGARARALHARSGAARSRSSTAAEASRDEPEAKGIPIGFTAKSDVPTGVVALVGARIITMALRRSDQGDAGVIENGTVVVEGNRITAVGPSASVRVPAGATRDRRRAARRSCPASSTCTAHLGGEGERHPRADELAARGQPRVRRHDVARSVERHRDRVHQRRADARGREARAARCSRPARSSTAPRRRSRRSSRPTTTRCRTLRRQKAVGAFSVKSYNQQRRDARQMIIKAARELRDGWSCPKAARCST